jgi:predicted permease
METLKQDVVHGLRLLWKTPGFTAVAILTLALGIGANTAIFSMVSWLLLRPLPVERPMELVELAYQQRHGNTQNQLSIPDYRDIRQQSTQQFSDMGAYMIGMDGISVDGRPDRAMTYYVTGSFFPMLGLQPQLGRLLMSSEGNVAGADPVIVLGHTYWRSRFNSDPGVIGRKVLVNGHPFTIVGVAPEGFHGPYPILEGQAYLPLGMNAIEGVPQEFMQNRGMRNLIVLARLRDGVTLDQSRSALKVIGQRLGAEHPKENQELDLSAYLEVRSRPQPDPNNTMLLLSAMFLTLAGIVLVLACLNVANLLLVRATIREREMAVRAALGATRIRLVRQLLTESVVLALLGGLAGLLVGFAGSRALSSVNIQTDLPVVFDFQFDWRVFAYGLGAALLTGTVVGLVPALRASRSDINSILHQGGRSVVGSGARLRTVLVVAQLAGSLMLLVVAGLFARSLQAAQKTSLGFDPTHVVNFYMDPSEIGYRGAQTQEFYQSLLERVRALPGVESATTASSAPMGYYNNSDTLTIDGFEPAPGQPRPGSRFVIISSDYLHTLRIPLMSGREFTDADDAKAPFVAIVNQTFAKKYWPKQDPIGRTFKLASAPEHTIKVVGVAADARYNGVTGQIGNTFYVPLSQHLEIGSLQALHVRTAGDPQAMIPQVQRLISSMAPALPIFDVKTMTQALNTLNGMMVFQIGAALAAVLGGLGLVLSVVGVYGVISYSAAQRTQEIGVRMALGARPIDILWMVLRQGSAVVVSGLALGLLISFAAGRLVKGFLVINPADPFTYSVVSLALTAVALTACYIPARRSTAVDPMVALRQE